MIPHSQGHGNLGRPEPSAPMGIQMTQMDDKPPTPPRKVTMLTDEQIFQRELKITNFIANRPCTVLFGCGGISAVLLFICVAVFTLKITQTELQDKNDYRTKRSDAVKLTDEDIAEMPPGIPGEPVDPNRPKQPLRSQNVESFSFVFRSGRTVFTLEALRFMKKMEESITHHKDFSGHCIVDWVQPTASCPGNDCPWYQDNWNFTKQYPMADGSRLICKPQYMSLVWLMYNQRVAIKDNSTVPPTYTECDVSGTPEYCIQNGVLSYISLLVGKTYGVQTPPEGVEPTEQELDVFIKLFARLRDTPEYSWLTPFFHKDFNDKTLPESDPARYYSKATRATIALGGPIENVNPKDIKTPCQSIMDGTSCNATEGCEWNGYGGFYRNMTSCNYKQFHEVSTADDASINDDQRDKIADFVTQFTDDFDNADGPVEVLYFSSGVVMKKFLEIIMRDALLALASFAFVYFYLQVHTRSFMLATLGMIQVLMPFPLAYFVYRGIFQVKGFYGLSALTLYIVLAIGADDIFVFMDAWLHTNVKPRHDSCVYLKGRLARSWKAAGKAMAVTSATTMAAFIATMTSPLLGISTFGLFAALLVFFDFMLVMTFFAAAVVVYHRGYENTLGCCCCGSTLAGAYCDCCTCYTTEVSAADEVACMQTRLTEPRTYESLEEARAALGEYLDHGKPLSFSDATTKNTNVNPMSSPEYKKARIVTVGLLVLAAVLYLIGFFALQNDHTSGSNAFLKWIALIVLGLVAFTGAMTAHHRTKVIGKELGVEGANETIMTSVLAPFLSGTDSRPWFFRIIPGVVLTCFWVWMIVEAFQLHHTTKNDAWLPDWHPLQKYMTSVEQDFPSNNQDVVQVVDIIFGFAPNPVDRSGTDKYDQKDKGKAVYQKTAWNTAGFQDWGASFCDRTLERSKEEGVTMQRLLNGEQDQNCVFKGFKAYRLGNKLTYPAPDFVSAMWDYTKYQKEVKETNPDAFKPFNDYTSKILYEFGNGDMAAPTDIKALMLHFNTTLPQWGAPHDDIREVFDDFNNWVDTEQKTAPIPFMQSSEVYIWMHTQALLVSGAVTGTIVSLVLAGCIVWIASMNIIIAVFVLLELIGVAGSVLGIVNLMGWELGMIESVSITILVGLSVDYVVHFAIHYTNVKFNVREERELNGFSERQMRVHKTVAEMGGTVLGGAATSIGASLILFCTWVQFFYKFGVVFLLTVVFSYTWAVMFFLPLMSFFGPQNEFCSLRPFLAKHFKFFQRKSDKTQDSSSQPSVDLPATSQDGNKIFYSEMSPGFSTKPNPLTQFEPPKVQYQSPQPRQYGEDRGFGSI